jgi:hypothetical protein
MSWLLEIRWRFGRTMPVLRALGLGGILLWTLSREEMRLLMYGQGGEGGRVFKHNSYSYVWSSWFDIQGKSTVSKTSVVILLIVRTEISNCIPGTLYFLTWP